MNSSEYNIKRSKHDFAVWVNEWSQVRQTLSRMSELNQRTRESKRMQEEAFVVYRYVKEFYRYQDIFIELRDGSQNFDAIIYDGEGAQVEYLEITIVPQENDHHLRRELVEKGGYSLHTILTHNPSLYSYAKSVSEGIKKKLAKIYPPDTTLLVELASEMVIEDDERFNYIISHLDPSLSAGVFRKIVLFDEVGTFYFTIEP